MAARGTKGSEATDLADHRETLWIALASIFGLAGVALVTTAALKIPGPTQAVPHPELFSGSGTGTPALFVCGVVCLLVAIYIVLAAFFIDRLRLPRTTREKAHVEKKTPEGLNV